MLRRLRSLWIWTASSTLIVSWAPLLGLIRLFDRDPLHLRTGRWFRLLGRLVAKINPWEIDFTGAENITPGETYVIVSNHQSLADIPVISHVPIDMKYLAKAELFRFPIFGWMMRMAGDIPVDRADRRKAAKAMLQCARHLRRHCSVLFFAEGTRSPDGTVLPFNEGPFQIAIREGVHILPIVIEGSGFALPRNTWIFGGKQKIHLRVLPPVSVEGWNVKRTAELRDLVRQSIVDEITRQRAAESFRVPHG